MSCCLKIYNIQHKDTVEYPILLIFGGVNCNTSCQHNVAVQCIDQKDSLDSKWPVNNGMFKTFVYLNQGVNRIKLQHAHSNSEIQALEIVYQPTRNKRFIRPVYIICGNSDGTFDAPKDVNNSHESATQRIAFNASLLQTFVAENMKCHGFGRMTFNLQHNMDGKVKVDTFHSKLSVEDARKKDGNQLYRHFHQELNASELADPNCKFWAFMSCTKYCPPAEGRFDDHKVTEYVKAHTALGGGNMALFGTAGLHTWASNINEIIPKFTDGRCIDRKAQFDDSCKRGTHWANYATTLGAAMHELGHCFDLPHTKSGIMGRGFDDMHLFFLAHKIEGDSGKEPSFSAYVDGGAHWHRSSAVSLSLNSWIRGNVTEERKPSGSPILSEQPDTYGPVGASTDDASFFEQLLDVSEWLRSNELTFGGFVFYAREYLEALRAIGYKYHDRTEVTYISPIIGNIKGKQLRTHRFLLTGVSERIVKIKIRAGCWIDGIQLFSNYKSSVWCGGTGGNVYHFDFDNGTIFKGLIASAGPHVGSLGVQVKRHETEDRERSALHSVPTSQDDTIGPVGADPRDSRFPQALDVQSWLNSEDLTFGGLVFYADNYINAIEAIGRKNEDMGPPMTCLSPLVGRIEGKGMKKCRFLITEEDEKIVKIIVRAGCWIDGIQIFSNYKSSVWCGGRGGNLHHFDFNDGIVFSGLSATAGPYVGSIGFQIKRTDVSDDVNSRFCYFVDSPSGVMLVEAQDEDGEVYFYKEYDSCKKIVLNRDFIHKGNKKCIVRIINAAGECSTHSLTLPS